MLSALTNCCQRRQHHYLMQTGCYSKAKQKISMSRKSRDDKSQWSTASIYAFTGNYGPFKVRDHEPISNCLLFLTKAAAHDTANKGNSHSLNSFAACLQNLLLQEEKEDVYHASRRNFQHVLIVNVSDMLPTTKQSDEAESKDTHCHEAVKKKMRQKQTSNMLQMAIDKESQEPELVKGFGKSLLRLLARLRLEHVVLAAHGDLCPVAI